MSRCLRASSSRSDTHTASDPRGTPRSRRPRRPLLFAERAARVERDVLDAGDAGTVGAEDLPVAGRASSLAESVGMGRGASLGTERRERVAGEGDAVEARAAGAASTVSSLGTEACEGSGRWVGRSERTVDREGALGWTSGAAGTSVGIKGAPVAGLEVRSRAALQRGTSIAGGSAGAASGSTLGEGLCSDGRGARSARARRLGAGSEAGAGRGSSASSSGSERCRAGFRRTAGAGGGVVAGTGGGRVTATSSGSGGVLSRGGSGTGIGSGSGSG